MDTRFWNAPGLDGALNGALYAYKRLRQYLNQAPFRLVPLRLRFLVAGGSRPTRSMDFGPWSIHGFYLFQLNGCAQKNQLRNILLHRLATIQDRLFINRLAPVVEARRARLRAAGQRLEQVGHSHVGAVLYAPAFCRI
jgi:hypothetical protein